MIVIVLDANILVSSPKLASREWHSLIDNASDWDVRIVIPEVAVMEAINVVTRNWNSRKAKVAAVEVGVFGLDEEHAAMLAHIDTQIAAYQNLLQGKLDELGIEVMSTPDVPHMEMARRASAGRAPFTKDKDGYRDTLLWYSVLAAAETYPDSDIWFVSDNTDDFGPKPPNWTAEGNGDRQACPILFHTELVAELNELGLSDRVHYVASLARIEQHIAFAFGPIDEATLAELADCIEADVLATQLIDALAGLEIDPDEGAFPVDVTAATVVVSHPPAGDWQFSEGARRGDVGWTARFLVETEVDLATTGALSEDGQFTKTLQIGGQITVAADGVVNEVAVDNARAPANDPMRAQRARRGAQGIESLTETVSRLQAASFALTENLKFDHLAGIDEQTRKNLIGLAGVNAQLSNKLIGFTGPNEQLKRTLGKLAGLSGLNQQVMKNFVGLASVNDQLAKSFTGLAGLNERIAKNVAGLAGLSGISEQIAQSMGGFGGASGSFGNLQQLGHARPRDIASCGTDGSSSSNEADGENDEGPREIPGD